MKKSILKLLVIPAFFLVAASVYAWTEPAVAPPGGNVTAPLRYPLATLGIGTVSPASLLEIRHDGSTINPFRITDTSSVIRDRFDQNFDLLLRNSSGVDNVKLTSNGISYFNGGSVGIGTTNPAAPLSVAFTESDSNGTGAFRVTSTNTSLRFGGNTTYSWIQSHVSKPLYINELGNNVILDLGGGSVGIGNANPGYKVDITGDVNVTGCFRVNGTCLVSGGGGSVGGSGTANTIPIWTNGTTLGNSALTQSGSNIVVSGAGGNWAGLNVPNFASWGSVYSYDSVCVGESNGNCQGSGGVVIGLQNSTSKTNIPTAGNTYFNNGSNVGIGTNNPAHSLDVRGEAAFYDPNNLSNIVSISPASTYAISTNGFIVSDYGVGFGQSVPPGSTSVCRTIVSGYNRLVPCTSLRKYKTNIQDLNLGINTVMQLRPVTFDWKDPSMGGHDLGFIAEEANAVDPILGQYDNGKLSGVKYAQMTAVLVKAAQDLQKENDQLKAQNDSLEARVSALEAKIK